jgi:hypothetical protein
VETVETVETWETWETGFLGFLGFHTHIGNQSSPFQGNLYRRLVALEDLGLVMKDKNVWRLKTD